MNDSVLQPRLEDSWEGDRALREALAFNLGEELFSIAQSELQDMGRMSTHSSMLELAARAERESPVHVPFSPWGERIDEIRVSDAYVALGRIGIEAGVTALPYENTPYGDRARIVWAGVMSMWGPSSALYSCPVAMTDAAARTLLTHGRGEDLEIVERLTTRDPDRAWTSGQWMTEITGGSDVSGTSTIARKDTDGTWRLFGMKWFTSATTSEMALTLARLEGAPEGSPGLSLFRIHRVLPDGTRNGIVVRRLKDKLGTRSLPTAELELQGAIAYPVGDPFEGGGVRKIATMLNITRIHNAIGSVGSLARGLAWARAYARARSVFGMPLHTAPAHRATLTDLAVDHAAALALALRCCELTGKVEHGSASEDEIAVLRGLTPVTKLATARWAVAGAAEAMEAVGGIGYCEDSTIPALVRNTHVQPIWEGTTNVLALDLLRAESRSKALSAALADARDVAAGEMEQIVRAAADEIERRVEKIGDDPVEAQRNARSLALSAARTYACARLSAQGVWAAGKGDLRTAQSAARLAERGLVAPPPPNDDDLAMDELESSPRGRVDA
jgi:alkylation response protein AidB-like acyl-CoA dehydrogenase